MKTQVEQVCVDEITMRFFSFGRGKQTLVILPGLSVQSVMLFADDVAAAYAPLTEAFTIYVFDRRQTLPQTYSVYDMAHDTAKVMAALGLKDVCLFGASQGGMIAMVLAAQYPLLVKKLALGSTAARITPDHAQRLAPWVQAAREKDGEKLYLSFGELVYPAAVFQAVRDQLLSAGKGVSDDEFDRFAVLAGAMNGFDFTARLREIRCPVLVLGAKDDAVLGGDASVEIAQALEERGDVELHMYEGCGHAAYDTAPDYKTRLLRFFQ
ncbi:MAG: alpha/beta hydrolase [Clostridia bacterium]|nr:alpha/beta hydrolase [Clostridia bacterium]